jgi:hypothetical protein
MNVLQDGSRRSSRWKPGDRNFGSVAIAARKRASSDWEERKKGWQESSGRRRFRSTGPPYTVAEEKKKGKGEGYCLPASSSSDPIRRPPAPPAPVPVAVVAAFDVCALLRKVRASVVDGLRWRWLPSSVLGGTCTTVGAKHHCCAERVEGWTWGERWGALGRPGGIALALDVGTGDSWLGAIWGISMLT